MSNWYATFTELREAGVTLRDWLEFHKLRRSGLTFLEKSKE